MDILMVPVGSGAYQPTWKIIPTRQSRTKHLKIEAQAEMQKGEKYSLKVLIDTGAEVNLVRKGLISAPHLKPAPKLVRFITANGGTLAGGREVVDINLVFKVESPVDEGQAEELVIPTCFYEAEISGDAILSYKWLADNDLQVYPREDCLLDEAGWVIKGLPDP